MFGEIATLSAKIAPSSPPSKDNSLGEWEKSVSLSHEFRMRIWAIEIKSARII